MPFCTSCGASLPASARFCSSCGAATAPSSTGGSSGGGAGVSSITGAPQTGASISNAYLMGGLGTGADINKELARVVGNTETVQQRSTQVRTPGASLGTCTACRQPVSGESIQALGTVWHVSCFKCGGTCGEQFARTGNTRVLEKDGIPYCENCYDAKFGEQCAGGCGRGLGPQRVKALGGLWHPECFRCASCRGKIEGGVINRGGKPFCKACAAK